MVKHDAVAGAETVTLAIIHGCPIRKNLGHAIRTAWPERRLLSLRHVLSPAEHFAAGCLKKTGTQSGFTDCFQDSDRAEAGNIGRVFRNVEAHAHVALRTEMINLIRLRRVKKFHQTHRVAEISVVQEHSDAVYMGIGVEMINTRSVEGAGAANDPVDFVAFLQQQIREITPILTSDAGNQRPFHLGSYCTAFDSLAPAHTPLSGCPSMSLGARWLHSVKRRSKNTGVWHRRPTMDFLAASP